MRLRFPLTYPPGPSIVATTAIAVALAVFVTGVLFEFSNRARALAAQAPGYVTASTCKSCHRDAYEAWSGSHHSWALREAGVDSVLGDFDNTRFEHAGVTSRFFMREGRYFVETQGPNGKPSEFQIRYTVGVAPLQQYLVELERGHLQALDIAWDAERGRWYHLYPDQSLKPGDGLHWTGPYKNWQARCAECHQTNFDKAYDPKLRAYRSTWSDLTVGCEACHGPGAAHVAWARDPSAYDPARFDGVDDKGLTVTFEASAPQAELQLCARCHARREPLGATTPRPSAPFADHYNLALLRQGLYHADGQIDDEVYVYGSFLQSKMHARGVRCTDCHTPHSATLKAQDNAVCTQCHNEAGNLDFPTLKPVKYNSADHHHHRQDSTGAQCVSCHMPAKTYMVIDGRRDHSFRVPRPDLSVKLGAPNACTQCHDDKPVKWAADWTKRWFPEGRSGTPHFAETLAAARARSHDTAIPRRLLDLAKDPTQPAIVRATALDHLRGAVNAHVLSEAADLLQDGNDLVRAAAAKLFRSAPGQVKFQRLMPLVKDPHASVRISAAREFINVPAARFPKQDRAKVSAAIREFQASLLARTDYPEIQMSLAGLALATRNLLAAESALTEALRMDPQLAEAWRLLARVQLAGNRPNDAHGTLERSLAALPDAGPLHHLAGNVQVQLKQDDRAIQSFRRGAQLMPNELGVRIDLAAALTRRGMHMNASEVIEEARRLSPRSPDVLALTAINRLKIGKVVAARDAVRELVRLHPRFPLPPELRALLALP